MCTKRLALLALLTLATAATAVPSTSAQTHIRAAVTTTAAAAPTTSSGSSASSANSDHAITAASLANTTAPSATAAATTTTTTTDRSVATLWSPDDPCSATTQRAGCIFEATCSLCLTRPGCAIESTTGKCVSVSRIRASTESDAAAATYIESGSAEYCDASDAACATCHRDSDSDAPCIGASGCVCMRQCERQSTAPLECLSVLSFTAASYIVMAAAVLCTASIGYHVRRARLHRALGAGRLVQRRRARPAASDAPHPLALKLDNWKKDRSDHSDAFVNIELKTCYVQMDDALYGHCGSSSHGASAQQEQQRQQRESLRETELGHGSVCSDLDGFEYVLERSSSSSSSSDNVSDDGDRSSSSRSARRDASDAA